MSKNLIDRSIEAVAPAWAVERVKSRTKLAALSLLPALPEATPAAGQSGATMSALSEDNAPGGPTPARRWWRPLASDARTDTLRFLPDQRGKSRELSRTSPIAAGAINTNVDRIVGTGLALSAQPNVAVLRWTPEQALAWKTLVQNEFSLWADSTECDMEQTLNFYQQQALVLRGTLESGDLFTNLPDGQTTATQPYALRIQTLEADRVGNPLGQMDTAKISGGVRLDDFGAPSAFYIYDQHPGGWLPGQSSNRFTGTWEDRIGRSGRRRILHHFRKLRPGMPRGVPYLAPIIDCIKQLSRYTEAEIMAAVVTAYLTVFIESPPDSPSRVFGVDDKSPGDAKGELELKSGAVVTLYPGEKAQPVNPGRPNPNFGPFIEAVITQIGMGLSLPRELLIKQFNASYSASKAALLDAWVYFRSVRNWLALSFCQPIYETWLAEAVATGRVPAPGFFTDPLMRWAYTRAAWPGDSMGSINPKDEVAAYSAAVDARFMTRERAEWELFGTDWNDTFTQKEAEHKRLKSADMLPVPKAGAAAPGPVSKGDQP